MLDDARRASTRTPSCKRRRSTAAPRWARGEQADRLGHGRGARVRLAAGRGDARAPLRAGRRAAARSATATRCCFDYDDRRTRTRRSRTSRDKQGRVRGATTARSREAGVLGFEYGYSLDMPDGLVDLGGAVRRLRERRAGDHRSVHRARRRTSGTALSGLVLLLPHGYEGQGPEHSSARLERFLQLVRRTTTCRSAT